MLRALNRADIRVSVIPSFPLINGLSFNVQVIFNGRSPFVIIQFTAVLSPTFSGSSPNEKGIICGGTNAKNGKLVLILDLDSEAFSGEIIKFNGGGGSLKCTGIIVYYTY